MSQVTKKPWSILIIGLLFIVLGFLFCFNSEAGINLLNLVISIILILVGIAGIIDFFRLRKIASASYILLIMSILTIVLGLVFLFNPNVMQVLAPIVFGIWILVMGISFFAGAFSLKKMNVSQWWIILLAAIISIIFAICVFFNLSVGVFTLTLIIGLYLIFAGCISIAGFFLSNKGEI